MRPSEQIITLLGRVSGIKPAVTLPLNARLVIEGDSIDIGSNIIPPYMMLALAQTQGRYYYSPSYMQAVSGKTVHTGGNQMLANIPNVVAARPDVVTLKIGTNTGIASDGGAGTWVYWKQAIIAYLKGGATWVVLMPVPPQSGLGGNTNGPGSSWDNERVILNNLIANFATDTDLTLYKNNIVAVANYDASWNVNTMFLSDGVHPNWLGGSVMAAPMATALNSIISSSTLLSLYTDATNILLAGNNPQLTGTSGTKASVSGQEADTWVAAMVTSGGLPAATAAKTTLNGITAQQCSVSGTNTVDSGAVHLWTLANNSTLPAMTVGAYYDGWIAFSATNCQGLETFSLKINNGSTLGAGQVGTGSQVMPASFPVSGVLRMPATQAASTSGSFFLESIFGNAVSSHVMIGAQPYLRQIPAGQV